MIGLRMTFRFNFVFLNFESLTSVNMRGLALLTEETVALSALK